MEDKMRVFESLVAGLENIGVTAAFGGAGETCTGMMLALKHSTQIRGIITRHEQAASFMACGYAMYANHLGVCWATAGPGAFNLFSGLGIAMSDSYPMLAITGYANRHWMGRGSLNETSGRNNTPDSQAMFAACTKGSWIIDHPDQTCDILEQAVNTAFAGRPGPVHIAVPGEFNLPGHDVTNHRQIQRSVETVSPDPARVDEIAVMLADAFAKGKSVVALVGFGAIRSGANSAVKEFIERFQIPLLTTLDGKGIVSENHPLSVGVFCDSGHASAWKAFMNADVVVAIGNAFNQHATFNYWEGLFDGRTLVHINISESEIDKVHKADYALVADAQLAVRAMTEALDAKTGARTPAVVDGRDYESRVITPLPGAIHPARLAQIVARSGALRQAKSTVPEITASFMTSLLPKVAHFTVTSPSPAAATCRCPNAGSSSPMPGRISLGSAIISNWRAASISARLVSSAQWRGTPTARSACRSRTPTGRSWSVAATVAIRCRASS